MKTYIGKGRQREGSALIELSFDVNQLLSEAVDASATSRNGRTFVKCTMARMRQPDNYGNTHTIWFEQREEASERYNNRLIDEQERRE
jgi:hypothetical protein